MKLPATRRHNSAGTPGWRQGLRITLVCWLEARLVVAVGFVIAHLALDRDRRLLGVAADYEPFWDGFGAWDSGWYELIARSGYQEADFEGLRFFPLWPLLGRWASPVFNGDPGLALVVLANLCAVAVGLALWRITLDETGDAALARRAVRILTLAPPAFVLVLAYSESLHLILSIGVFLLMARERWMAAALAGFLAGLTRPIGVLLSLPVAYHIITSGALRRPSAVLAALAPPAGSVSFLVWVHFAHGDATAPLDRQRELRGEVSEPVGRFVEAVRSSLRGDMGEMLHVLTVLAIVVLTVIVIRRLGRAMALYTLASAVVLVSSQNLGSLARYGLGVFPLAIAAAHLASRRIVYRMLSVALWVGLATLTGLALSLRYVP